MKFVALFIGGVVGAAETSVSGVLAAGYFSWQIMNALGLLLFLFTVPTGALLGTVVAAAVVRLDDSHGDCSSLIAGWFLAVIVGFPVSWIAAMMFSFGPPTMIVSLFAIQLIGLFVLVRFLFRSQRSKP